MNELNKNALRLVSTNKYQESQNDLIEVTRNYGIGIKQKVSPLTLFDAQNLIDYFYLIAFNPASIEDCLNFIMKHFQADAALITIIDRTSQEKINYCEIGDLQIFSTNLNSAHISISAQNERVAGSLILLNHSPSGFSDEFCAQFKFLEPHFKRCINICENLRNRSLNVISIKSIIDVCEIPAALASIDGKLITINEAAVVLLGLGRAEDFVIDAFWLNACNFAKMNSKYEYEFKHKGKSIIAQLSVIGRDHGSQQAAIAIYFNIKSSPKIKNIQDFAKTYNLTKAEQDILEQLCDGQVVANIARARNASTETVRTQLRSLRAKTETKSQLELITLVHQYRKFS